MSGSIEKVLLDIDQAMRNHREKNEAPKYPLAIQEITEAMKDHEHAELRY